MGEVYRARDTRLGREVAIKILPADVAQDRARLERFEREARAVSALNHPHIVTLHEIATSESGPYIVMERIDGQSLREILAAGPMPVRRLLAIAAQIAEGLAKAHAAGIVHRDLKPDNVMVNADGFVKIVDFGLAKLVLDELDGLPAHEATTVARHTESGMVLGTVGYLSPEQAAGRPVDFHADQFAFGALMYEMATRERPFRRGTFVESLAATMRDDPEPLRSKRPDAPAQLGWIVDRCLAKDPNARFASTTDLARDLADLRDHLSEITRAPAEGLVGSARPPVERSRRWLALALALAAFAAAIGGTYLLTRSTATAAIPSYRPLTFGRGIITGAKFSTDGGSVYYSGAFGGGSSKVYVTRVDAAASEPLNMPAATILSVSRKGELLVLLTDGLVQGQSAGTLARVAPVGGTPRQIAERVLDADWAPDGEQMAVLPADKPLEYPAGRRIAADAFQPRVSPQGDKIASVSSGADGGIDVRDRDGHSLLHYKIPYVFGLAWTPDAREVWFTGADSGDGSGRALYALSLDGRRRLLARVPGAITIQDISPDGKSALVSSGAAWLGAMAFHPRDNREQSLDLFGRTEVVFLSADGRWVAALDRRDVARGVYMKSVDGTQTFRLGDGEPLAISSDGSHVLIGFEGPPIRLALMPTGAGTPIDVPIPPGSNPLLAHWSEDGRRLFMLMAQNGHPTSVFVREADNSWRSVSPEVVQYEFAVSPDGHTVAAWDATSTVTLFPVDGGGSPKRLDGATGVPLGWSSDGKSIFLRRELVLPPVPIMRLDVATGRVEKLFDLGPADPSGISEIPWIRPSKDGNVWAFTYARLSNELYLVQGLR
jgi:Tol biopolymer transport system component